MHMINLELCRGEKVTYMCQPCTGWSVWVRPATGRKLPDGLREVTARI